MISIESYRSHIGSFNFTAQKSVRYVAKSIVVGTVLTSNGLAHLIKPVPFFSLFMFLTFACPKSYEINSFHQSLPVLNFLSVSKNGLFVLYPSHYLRDPSVIFLKVNYTLFLSGDIELNPGPTFQVSKCVQGSFNQSDVDIFGTTAGIQCSCNALVSIIYSKCKQLNFWKTSDLDLILIEGDKNLKVLGFTESPYVDQFPKNILLEEQMFSLEFENFLGEFVSTDIAINFVQEELLFQYLGALFVIDGYTLAIMYHNNNFYVFDSHSRDGSGCKIENGTSVLLQFGNLKMIRNYIQNTYNTSFFNVLYVKINCEDFDCLKCMVNKSILKKKRKLARDNRSKSRHGTELHERVKKKE